MLIELYIFSIIILTYGVLITSAIIGFNKLRLEKTTSLNQKSEFISIVVSARNEEHNIQEFLHEINKQNFPKTDFELIIIDDCSEDDTYLKAKEYLEKTEISYQLIQQNSHQGKKECLSLAISLAKGNIIITTDADVIYRHTNWLSTIAYYFKNNLANLLIMPVDFKSRNSILSIFQITENLALTGITAGFAGIKKPFLCNGANLAFKKNIFDSFGGYKSHSNITSGEDIFLLEDMKRVNPNAVHYLFSREVIIKTNSEISFKDFINQRIRWASKTKQNPNILNSLITFIILLANLVFLALFVAMLKKSVILHYLSIFALTKCVFDFLLLFLAADFLGRLKYIWWLIPFECIYWLYAFYVGLTSLFIKPAWKGKKIK